MNEIKEELFIISKYLKSAIYDFIIIIIFSLILSFCLYSQNLNNIFFSNIYNSGNWKSYQIANYDISVKFPGKPSHYKADTNNIFEQHTYRFLVEKLKQPNYYFLITVFKYKIDLKLDSLTFNKAANILITSQMPDNYKNTIISQEGLNFKNSLALKTKTTILLKNYMDVIYNGIVIKHNEFLISMFVLSQSNSLKNEEIEDFFNSLNFD